MGWLLWARFVVVGGLAVLAAVLLWAAATDRS
jgi:hypothetical protein